eukprot:727587-Pleurochrysis_carterae.AAC.1
MEMDCVVWKSRKRGGARNGSHRNGEKVRLARQGQVASRWMRCQVWRLKSPKTSRMSGMIMCPRHSASWYFACWNVVGQTASCGAAAAVIVRGARTLMAGANATCRYVAGLHSTGVRRSGAYTYQCVHIYIRACACVNMHVKIHISLRIYLYTPWRACRLGMHVPEPRALLARALHSR